MRLGISEIVDRTAALATDEEKINFLRAHDSIPLRVLFQVQYDKHVKLFVNKNNFPYYKPSVFPDTHGNMYREYRLVKYIIKGRAGDTLPDDRRMRIIVQILETVHPSDAEYFKNVLLQVPTKGISIDIINQAFGDIIDGTKVDKKGK